MWFPLLIWLASSLICKDSFFLLFLKRRFGVRSLKLGTIWRISFVLDRQGAESFRFYCAHLFVPLRGRRPRGRIWGNSISRRRAQGRTSRHTTDFPCDFLHQVNRPIANFYDVIASRIEISADAPIVSWIFDQLSAYFGFLLAAILRWVQIARLLRIEGVSEQVYFIA